MMTPEQKLEAIRSILRRSIERYKQAKEYYDSTDLESRGISIERTAMYVHAQNTQIDLEKIVKILDAEKA